MTINYVNSYYVNSYLVEADLMPEVRNCHKCRKIFMYSSGPQICDSCKRLEEEEFELVRSFLRDFPGATVQEVSRETKVSTQLIYRFLKEGRLEVSESSALVLECESCGARIKSGRFCMNCTKKLANDMITAGNSLKSSVKDEYSADIGDHGLRYIHGIRKED
jgi:flagellar operon protein (TIGR03826 family)